MPTKVEELELTIWLKDGKEDAGVAIITRKGEIEFEDSLPVSMQNLEYTLKVAKKFLAFKKRLEKAGV